jgi:hypothetical protein
MLTARHSSILLASAALILATASTGSAQTAGGADRYLGQAQGSLNRTNATINSLSGSNSANMRRSMGIGGGAVPSVNRTNAMIHSMNANRAATMRGMQQQVIYRTQDNLYGVYWQAEMARQARINTNGTGAGANPMLAAEAMKHRARQQARSVELQQRFEQRGAAPLVPFTHPPRFNSTARPVGN